MVAQLLEDTDGRERLRVRATQKRFDLRRGDEEAVKRELEVGEPAENDLFVFDGHYLRNEINSVIVGENGGTHDI